LSRRSSAELAQVAADVTVVQEHAPGAEAEIDFGEFFAWIAGEQVKLWLFIMRLSASGRSFVVAFAHQAQEAFFEGHVLAFAHFGGVPFGQIRYDNLKPAVIRILKGRTAPRTNGSPRCGRTTGSMRSSASPASKARMRRAGWRARSAGSAAGIWSRSPTSRVWPRSTN
jgi:transposase